MSTYGSIEEDVKAYLGEFSDDFDVDGIVSDIRDAGVTDIDDMDADAFQAIIQAHDMTDELKPCPYCGGLPEIRRGDSRHTVIEHQCPIVGYMVLELLNVRKDDFEHEKRRCIKRWNMRRKGYSDD